MVTISTSAGDREVWSEKVGDNPAIKLLLLHGGPGATHEYFEGFGDHLPQAGIEFNPDVYVPMQGPSELGLSGKLLTWDRSGDLANIDVPTLVIGASHDTMDPSHMAAMAERLPKGRFLLCENGSHLAMWDDEQTYFDGLIDFLTSV